MKSLSDARTPLVDGGLDLAGALAAGALAAVLFAQGALGQFEGIVLSFCAGLPVMVAAAAFGPAAGLVAGAASAATFGAGWHAGAIGPVATVPGALLAALLEAGPSGAAGPRAALLFALAVAAPAWLAGVLATRGARPARLRAIEAGASASLASCAIFAGLAAAEGGGAQAGLDLLSLAAARAFEIAGVAPPADAPGPLGAVALSVFGALSTLMLSLAAWPIAVLAGERAQPGDARPPRWLAVLFAGAVVGGFERGAAGSYCLVAATAAGAAFFLQGLALCHALLGRARAGGPLLAGLYLGLLVVPFPIPLLVAGGWVDSFLRPRGASRLG